MTSCTNEFCYNLGLALTAARKSKNMTRSELSLRSGVPYTTLECAENGKSSVTVWTLVRITKALGVSVGEVLADAEQWI